VASSPAPAPLDKGKRVLEVLYDDEDSSGGVVMAFSCVLLESK